MAALAAMTASACRPGAGDPAVALPAACAAALSVSFVAQPGTGERLFDCGVLPYYLHLLDPVAGAAHFDVAVDRGVDLVSELRQRMPGYLVPRLVRETPGELSKTLIA